MPGPETPAAEDSIDQPVAVQFAAFLDEHRRALDSCLDGVSEEQARRRLLASKTTLLGLVKHATFVEKVWFGEAVTGRSRPELGLQDGPDESFDLGEQDTIASVRQAHREACVASRSAVADLGLDDLVHGNRRGPLPLRWVFLHVLRELAQHCGHADILREQLLHPVAPPTTSAPRHDEQALRPATRLLRAGRGQPTQGAPLLDGPVFAGTYRHVGDPTDDPYTYGRYSNPTWSAYEAALTELEGGPALVLSSGMAAVAAVLCAHLRPGDVLVLPSDGYYTVRLLAGGYLTDMGVQVRLAPSGPALMDVLDGARLLWLESPTNPGLDVCDLRALAGAAHRAGALVAVDNTTATVLAQQPLSLGADFSVSSDTKALTGHADLVLGHVAVRDPALLPALRSWRTQVGAVAGPMETWLAHRSLATLDVRLRRQCSTALTLATALAGHPAVLDCRYPGLPGDPAHALAASQMSLYGPVVGVTLRDQEAAEALLDAVRVVTPATSFGGVHSTAERRARWGGDDVHPGFLRLSVGLEDPDDLLEDLTRTLGR